MMGIDHLLVTAPLQQRVAWDEIDREARKGKPLPSDHAPLVIGIDSVRCQLGFGEVANCRALFPVQPIQILLLVFLDNVRFFLFGQLVDPKDLFHIKRILSLSENFSVITRSLIQVALQFLNIPGGDFHACEHDPILLSYLNLLDHLANLSPMLSGKIPLQHAFNVFLRHLWNKLIHALS